MDDGRRFSNGGTRNGDLVVGLGNHLIDRGHSPGVEITADQEFGVLRILFCGFYAARSVNGGRDIWYLVVDS